MLRVTERGLGLVGLLLGEILLMFLGAAAQQCITVHPEESLQAMIDNASPGTVICLTEGVWQENIVITKSLTLRGQGPERTRIEGLLLEEKPVVEVKGNWIQVTLEGLKVTGAYWDDSSDEGILVSGKAQVIIRNCDISKNKDGILLEDAAKATIESCTLSENMNGIYLSSDTQAMITDCTVYKNYDGIDLSGSAQATIEGCTLSENEDGISIWFDAQATIEGNTIYANRNAGIYSNTTGEVQGYGNEMRDNGVDLMGNVTAALRLPLVEATEKEIVFPDPRYPTLQHAVDALLPGGRLVLKPGGYEGGLTIGKELEIVGEKGTKPVLRGRGEAPVVSLVGGAKVFFQELKVSDGNYGFYIAADAQAVIQSCAVFDNEGYSIILRDGSQATIADCIVYKNKHVGIVLIGSSQATIESCKVFQNDTGFKLGNKSQAIITKCTISFHEDIGIDLLDDTQATVSGCRVFRNERHGIAISGRACVTMTDCTVSNNKRCGVILHDSSQTTIIHNKIENNGWYGIGTTQFTGYVAGKENIIRDNGLGDVELEKLTFLMSKEGGVLGRRKQ